MIIRSRLPLPIRLAVALVVLGFVAWRYFAYSPVEAPPMTADSTPTITATNAFYYYQDVDSAWDFYTTVLGFETVADYGFAKILRVAPTSYLTSWTRSGGCTPPRSRRA
jgi:hypothetical protein